MSKRESSDGIILSEDLLFPARDLKRFDFRFEYALAADLEVSRRYSFQLATLARNGETEIYPFDSRDADPLGFTDVPLEIRAKVGALIAPIVPEFEELAARYLGTLCRAEGLPPGFTLAYIGTIDFRPYDDYSYSGLVLFGADGDIDNNDSWKRNYFVNNDGSIYLDNRPQLRASQLTPLGRAIAELDVYDEVISEFLSRTKGAYQALRAELRAS